MQMSTPQIYMQFQSTLLVRGATKDTFDDAIKAAISIHAPRERSDAAICGGILMRTIFQSTLLVRGATFW